MARLPFVTVPALFALTIVACGGDQDGDHAGIGPSSAETDDGEEVTSRREEHFEETGVRVVRAKVVDRVHAAVRDRSTDPTTGRAVDYDALRGAEMRAMRERFGALVPSFARELAGSSEEAIVAADVLAESGTLEGEGLRRELSRAGANVLRVDGALATVEASAAVLRSMSRDPRVASIAPRVASVTTSLAAAKDLGQVSLQWPHLLGIGSDLTIAVVEPNVCIRRTHQDFRWVTFDSPASGCSLSSGHHSTAVAGVLSAIRWVDGSWQGAGLFRAHIVESDVSSGALARDPDLFNMSATHSPIEVKMLDEAVWNKRTMMFAGSANADSGTSGTTCHAYNLTCVGGYGTSSTPGVFGDDVHATSAMWQNPPSGREEPDLVGPMGVRTASWERDDAYASYGGTSFATPAVTGLAGLLVAKHRTQLGRQPTLMRALLAASAIVHPVNDGDSTRVPIIGDGVDDKTGAGAPNGAKASAIVESGTYHAAKVTKSSHFDANGKYVSSFSLNAAQGQRVRVALTWDNCPVNPLSYPNQDALVVDLDLAVRGPNVSAVVSPYPPIRMQSTRTALAGTKIGAALTVPFFASNASHVDNYETVELVAPVAGTYRIEVTAPRWGVCPYDNSMSTNLALAWTTN